MCKRAYILVVILFYENKYIHISDNDNKNSSIFFTVISEPAYLLNSKTPSPVFC